MNTKIMVDRFLSWPLPESLCSDPCASMPGYPHRTGTNLMTAEQAKAMLDYVLAAPRQPEEDAASILLPALRQYMHNDGSGLLAGYEYERTQQIVAELREGCEHLKDCQENAMLHMTGLVSERDTLRQQLAELRAQLLAIASAEPRRHTIEWAKAMAVTGNNEAYAKWREAFDQRDKLAGLLADVKADYTHAIHWEDMHATMKRIDAALAEVKPCLESPAPTT